jgi:formylglycine-generating enzyme required for sulfatase activity
MKKRRLLSAGFSCFLAVIFLGASCSKNNPVSAVPGAHFIPPMVDIPAGSFQMGSTDTSDEQPVHTVAISAFRMSVTEINQGQYKAIMGVNPSGFKGDDNLPVEQVSWFDAIKFCNAVSDSGGLNRCYDETTGVCDFTKNGIRLPTEAEWEFACRAGTITKYYSGDSVANLNTSGWYLDNSGNKTHPVAKRSPNAWGLYDMNGNVWEWCNDWAGTYSSASVTNPTGPQGGNLHVIRGGGWNSPDFSSTSAYRNYAGAANTLNFIGFRVVRR